MKILEAAKFEDESVKEYAFLKQVKKIDQRRKSVKKTPITKPKKEPMLSLATSFKPRNGLFIDHSNPTMLKTTITPRVSTRFDRKKSSKKIGGGFEPVLEQRRKSRPKLSVVQLK